MNVYVSWICFEKLEERFVYIINIIEMFSETSSSLCQFGPCKIWGNIAFYVTRKNTGSVYMSALFIRVMVLTVLLVLKVLKYY